MFISIIVREVTMQDNDTLLRMNGGHVLQEKCPIGNSSAAAKKLLQCCHTVLTGQ